MKRRYASQTTDSQPETPSANRSALAWFKSRTGLCVGSLAAFLVVGYILSTRLLSSSSTARVLPDRTLTLEQAKLGLIDSEAPLQKLLQHDPTDLEVVKALLNLKILNDQPSEADQYLVQWSELEPENLAPVRLRFELASRVFDYPTATQCGERLLGSESNRVPLLRRLAAIELDYGRVEYAAKYSTEGLALLPDDEGFRYQLAQIEHSQGRLSEAGQHLDAILHQNPQMFSALLLRGTIHREQEQPNLAIPLLKTVIEQDPAPRNRQLARYQLAQAYFQLNLPTQAEQVMARWSRYEEARRLLVDAYQQPENQDLRLKAAQLLLDTDQEQEGFAVVEWILRENPRHPEVHQLLANYHERLGHLKRAEFHRMIARSVR